MSDGKLNILLKFRNEGSELSKAVRGVKNLALGLSAVALGWMSVRSASRGVWSGLELSGEFEADLNRVRALLDATEDEMMTLSSTAEELGATTQYSASQAVQAMAYLAQAGYDANKILEAIPDTLNLAAAANVSLGEAADIVVGVLAGYNKEADELAHVNDVLVKSMSSGKTTLLEMGDGMKYVGPIASGLGIAFEETTAALSILANRNIGGQMGGTALRGILSKMVNQTSETQAVFERLNVDVLDSEGNLRDLADIIEDLEGAGATTADMFAAFGQRAGPGMAVLLSVGADSLRDLTNDMENCGGITDRVASVQMQGFIGSLRALKSAWQGNILAATNGGLLDVISSKINGVAADLRETIPLVRSFFSETLKAAQDGNLSEWLSLSIQAGFETARTKAADIWSDFWDSDFLRGTNGVMVTLGTELSRTLTYAFVSSSVLFGTMMSWEINNIKDEIKGLNPLLAIDQKWNEAWASVGEAIGAKGEVDFRENATRIKNLRDKPDQVKFEELQQDVEDATNKLKTKLPEIGDTVASFTESLMASMLGVDEEPNQLPTDDKVIHLKPDELVKARLATASLLRTIAENQAKSEVASSKKVSDAEKDVTDKVSDHAEAVRALSKEELELIQTRIEGLRFEREQLVGLADKRQLTTAELDQLEDLTNKERDQLDLLIDHYQKLAESANTSALERVKAENMVASLQATRSSVGSGTNDLLTSKYDRSINTYQQQYSGGERNIDNRSHFETPLEGLQAGAADYLTSVGTIGDNLYSTVGNIASGMQQGIGGALKGLITDTMSWNDAMLHVGDSILSGIIGSFSSMVAQYITSRLAMWIFGEALDKATLASTLTTAGMIKSVWTGAAVAAGIATLGSATAGGVAALTMIEASSLAGAIPGFAEGRGPVRVQPGVFRGRGGPTEDANLAWISDEESILSAAATAGVGANAIGYMNEHHTLPPAFASGRSGSVSGRGYSFGGNNSSSDDYALKTIGLLERIADNPSSFSVAVTDNDKAALRALNSKEGKTAVISAGRLKNNQRKARL